MRLPNLSRRDVLFKTGLIAGAALFAPKFGIQATQAKTDKSIIFCLNTATIRGQKLGIVKEIEIAAKAGYNAFEPWIDSLEEYKKDGGSLPDLRKRISDAGLSVEGTIAFPEWIVEDDAHRAKALEEARREMDMAAQIGAKRIAAPPAGATNLPRLDLIQVAARYRALLDIGDQIGIIPELELWGFSKNLSRLGECACVALEAGHPKACILIDAFHLYKGGSDIHGIPLLGSSMIQVLHMNDYPAEPAREKINDSYRTYPGNGIAPLAELISLLRKTGGTKVLSLELFSKKFWAQDPLKVAQTGLEKMKVLAAQS